MFGEIIGQMSCSKFPKHFVMSLNNSVLYPIKTHIHGFGAFFCTFMFTMLYVVEVPVCMGMAACGRPIFSRVVIIVSPALVLWSNAPTSTSAADNVTFFITLEMLRMNTLVYFVLLKYFYPRKKFLRCDF